MKNLKRALLILLVVCMVLSLFACGKKMECELCGQEKTCHKVTVKDPTTGEKESGWFCKDCEKLVKAMVKAMS